MVSPPNTRRMPGPGDRAKHSIAWPVLLLVLGALALVSAVSGGLIRAGVPMAVPAFASHWAGHAAVAHGALMICCFMGTVIGIERAVAVKRRAAWLSPAASGLGGICLLAGHSALAAGLLTTAAMVFVGVNLVVVQRQRAAHTLLLLASALAWLVGNALYLRRPDDVACLPWWFAFLTMTIAAERLEMTRLMRRRPEIQTLLTLILGLMAAGAALSSASARLGGLVYGASLCLLAVWLGIFDIARRTVAAHGLSRYMAVCLLGGYVWLAIAGVAWAGTAAGLPWRDAALHALGLGFIFSMMMGHAPVILPAIARVKLQFHPVFYLPLAALHLSLAIRLVLGLEHSSWRATGALLNAGTIVLFVATMVFAAWWWRARVAAAR